MDEQMSDNNNVWFVLFFWYVLGKIIHFDILSDLSLIHDCAKLLLLTHGSTRKAPHNRLDRVTLLCDLARSISLNGLSSSHQTKLFRSSTLFPLTIFPIQHFTFKGFPVCTVCSQINVFVWVLIFLWPSEKSTICFVGLV